MKLRDIEDELSGAIGLFAGQNSKPAGSDFSDMIDLAKAGEPGIFVDDTRISALNSTSTT